MDILEMQARIAALSPPTCKKCCQPRMLVADELAKSKTHFDEDGNLTVISKGLVPHESGLCYFHLKKEEGWFDAKYPLWKYRRKTDGSTLL